jgi:hypothetical protein
MKKGYIGTLASDIYPLNKTGKSYAIMNTDGHKKKQEHIGWLFIGIKIKFMCMIVSQEISTD